MADIKHSKPTAGAGWIAPDGKFYSCAWYQHDSLGSNLMQQFGYKDVESWERDWLRLKYDPTTRSAPFVERKGFDEYTITQAQLTTLYDVLAAFLLSGIEVNPLREYIQRARIRDARR
jgi:hypothetical protein